MQTLLIHLGYIMPKGLQSGAIANNGYYNLEAEGNQILIVETSEVNTINDSKIV